ncbi:hypothetical protein [Cellulophaga baltica]|uniref:hypothetical protein n=1 Tax=Cellulophaga baltica TaxID=76594 RepID=UPI0024956616|nr:hypothetical protein [Cellulophaga baltica]
MKKVKVLKPYEFYFRILITEESEYFGLEGLIRLTGNLPATVTTIAVKESKPISKLYCLTHNHSDYIGIEDRLNVKTEMM